MLYLYIKQTLPCYFTMLCFIKHEVQPLTLFMGINVFRINTNSEFMPLLQRASRSRKPYKEQNKLVLAGFHKSSGQEEKKKENKGPTGTLQRDEIRTFPLNGRGLHSGLALNKVDQVFSFTHHKLVS